MFLLPNRKLQLNSKTRLNFYNRISTAFLHSFSYMCPVSDDLSKIWREYRKFPKYSDTQKICCNHSKIWTMWLYHSVMSPNDADEMANSVDSDRTAPRGAVWSGSALFAQVYLSENSGSLRYPFFHVFYYRNKRAPDATSLKFLDICRK